MILKIGLERFKLIFAILINNEKLKRDRDRNRLDRIEDRIGKLTSDFNDIIRKKV